MTSHLYIGLISGTSMDGVDCVLAEIGESVKVIGQLTRPIPREIESALLKLCDNKDLNLQLIGETDIALAQLFAEAVEEILDRHALSPQDIKAIGSHGQTIWHEPPRKNGARGFTMQLCDANTLAALTSITTVADFRGMDMAAGGQGAPLVPAFHRQMFQKPGENLAVLNLGGIANITLIPANRSKPSGFDTGPANVLMDVWTRKHLGKAFDSAGSWAASGKLNDALLAAMLDEPYFALPPPKSTGRELFNAQWLEEKTRQVAPAVSAADVQRTLAELTAITVSSAIRATFSSGKLVVCGGGAGNTFLVQRVGELLENFALCTSSDFGIHPDFVEAAAFAWFASMRLAEKPVDFPPFTGAGHRVISGAVYCGQKA